MFICNHAGLAGSEVVADIKRLDVAFVLSSYLRVKVKSIAGAGVSETI